MGLETYRTWVVDAVLTAAQLNEQIRDNGNELLKDSFTVVFDGAGAPIVDDTAILIAETGFKFTIDSVTLKSPGATIDGGDLTVFDIWVVAAGSDTATSDNSICASALPTFDSDNPDYKRDATLTGWSPTIEEGSSITFIAEINTADLTNAVLSVTYTRAS